jgi:hypothetical protein
MLNYIRSCAPNPNFRVYCAKPINPSAGGSGSNVGGLVDGAGGGQLSGLGANAQEIEKRGQAAQNKKEYADYLRDQV